MVYLIGISGDRAGQVRLHDQMIDPWDEPERWGKMVPSFAAFLGKCS